LRESKRSILPPLAAACRRCGRRGPYLAFDTPEEYAGFLRALRASPAS
jgi:hypothetical protein